MPPNSALSRLSSVTTQIGIWWYCLKCKEYFQFEEWERHSALLCAVRRACKDEIS